MPCYSSTKSLKDPRQDRAVLRTRSLSLRSNPPKDRAGDIPSKRCSHQRYNIITDNNIVTNKQKCTSNAREFVYVASVRLGRKRRRPLSVRIIKRLLRPEPGPGLKVTKGRPRSEKKNRQNQWRHRSRIDYIVYPIQETK